ncbi:MAG TPA: hypothetical protein VK636_21325 [Gemmatimonadaceae bacterium]|nr:hypothetical protein [Gemmatimonadaceae bacterium]
MNPFTLFPSVIVTVALLGPPGLHDQSPLRRTWSGGRRHYDEGVIDLEG